MLIAFPFPDGLDFMDITVASKIAEVRRSRLHERVCIVSALRLFFVAFDVVVALRNHVSNAHARGVAGQADEGPSSAPQQHVQRLRDARR